MRPVYQSLEGYEMTIRQRKFLDYPLHLHNAVEILFLQKGSCRVINDNQSVLLTAGDVFVSFPNQLHAYEDSRDTLGCLLILPVKPWLQVYSQSLLQERPVSCCLKKGQWEHSRLPLLVELVMEDRDQVSKHVLQGYCQAIVGKLLELIVLEPRQGLAEDGIRSVLSYIHAHYRQPLTRQQIAQAVGYNESYISHFFAENLHMSLGRYIQSLRVEDALQLLEQTQLSISQIVGETGFGSIRSFNRAFQRIMGISPRAYREGLRLKSRYDIISDK